MKPKLKQRKLHPSKDPELARLAGVVGQFIEYWGFKEVQGRLWLYLFVSHDPLSSTELAQLLKISPALVTQSVKILLQYQVILTAPKGQNGVLRYRANPNVAQAIRGVLQNREALMLKQTIVQAEKVLLEEKSGNRSGVTVSPEKVILISTWANVFGSMLSMALNSLVEEKNAFSHPQDFQKQLKFLIDNGYIQQTLFS